MLFKKSKQMVSIPREILWNLAEAVHAQTNSEQEFTSVLDNLRQLPENTIGCEVVRFIDGYPTAASPFSKAN